MHDQKNPYHDSLYPEDRYSYRRSEKFLPNKYLRSKKDKTLDNVRNIINPQRKLISNSEINNSREFLFPDVTSSEENLTNVEFVIPKSGIQVDEDEDETYL